jgi:Mrp family chromosome partitioning ATPase
MKDAQTRYDSENSNEASAPRTPAIRVLPGPVCDETSGLQKQAARLSAEVLPRHTDWLFSACEPRIADLVHRVDMRFSRDTKRIVQFIGANRGVGASTVAFAYASASASLRQRNVLFLCMDERKSGRSVMTCLSEGISLNHAVTALHDMLFYGVLSWEDGDAPEARALLADAAAWQTIGEAFDEVVLDCRPIEASRATLAIAPHADGVVVVIQAARTQQMSARALLDALNAIDAPVLGAVLNQRVSNQPFDSHSNEMY